ncbi:autotransporter outer membrane beta-barrel domain-containing protein [Phascolarctobacterium succinatutens]|uniref:autotransporter outer membrane beta-barrel domain-containing protein n=1 Tax=Phascolarctobacterium succinatutens TaxID=626940 RepID=UPI0026ECFF52|nr:autotransporter outer membrane beta-barrel domain-containing protein [Phascolarctobacterium succinatutens]
MMKKKALIVGVLLSVCSINMGAQAAFHSKIDINTDKEITYETTFSGTSNSPEVGAITAPSFTDANDTGATINIFGNNNKIINFVFTGSDKENSSFVIDYNTGIGHSIGVLNNSAGADVQIKSDKDIWFVNNIYSGHASADAIKSQYAIKNEAGTLTVKSNLKIGLNNKIPETAALRNEAGATLNIIGDVHIASDTSSGNVFTGSVIENEGNMTINGKVVCSLQPDYFSADTPYVAGYNAISNKGDFTFNARETYIDGDIEHFSGAQTNINLSHVLEGAFWGAIKGSDANFHMTLGENAFWSVPANQTDVVYGLKLNGGVVYVNTPNYYNYGSTDVWNTKFQTVTFANLQTNEKSAICVSTDLLNDVGDKVVLTGTVPAELQLGIKNKDDNGGVPIKETDGHSVTVVHVDGDNKINLKTGLMFYNLEIAGGDDGLSLYTPIIKEEALTSGALITGRDYNFVGWGSKAAGDILDQQLPTNEPYINSNELDNVFKRLMDIRNDPSEVGVWIRGETGEMKIDGYGYDYNMTSGGHDWKHESNAAIMFGGFGITHSVNKCDTGIIGDAKSTGYNLYGSWLGKDNNDYIDVILKYGKMDKTYAGLDINNVFAGGNYSKDVFSIAAKYGRRYEMRNDWYYEPFAGLTWGRISDVDFKDTRGFKIHGDSVTSKMANIGIQVGKKLDKHDIYYRMNLVHDFDGEMYMNVPGTKTAAYTDMGGTWLKFAVGTSAKVGKNNSFYIDLERDFGSRVEKPWAISAGYRHTW